MVRIDGANLTCDQVAEVARRRTRVELAPDALERVARSYELAERLSGERPV